MKKLLLGLIASTALAAPKRALVLMDGFGHQTLLLIDDDSTVAVVGQRAVELEMPQSPRDRRNFVRTLLLNIGVTHPEEFIK